MSLEQTLNNAVSRLRAGNLHNEAQVKQAVILPILRALDWDDTNPEAFKPEYKVGKGLVDYALLDRGKPWIFVEAKRLGAIRPESEEQLFSYASNRGVPILVLTDGDCWGFYLSMAPGIPTERQFYQLKLLLSDESLEDRIPEYVTFLQEHLQKDRVISDRARISAEQILQSNRKRERAREAIPGAWQALLSKPEDLIYELVADEVVRKCGTKPEPDDVYTFLRNPLPVPQRSNGKPRPLTPSAPVATSQPRSSRPKQSKILGFILDDERVDTGKGNETLAEILIIFGRRDPKFMEAFAAKTVSPRRALIARKRSDLYKTAPHLEDKSSRNLGNGWWLGTHLSSDQIRRHIETACSVAGVSFGSQLKIIER